MTERCGLPADGPSQLVAAIRRARSEAALARERGHDRTADRHLEDADLLIDQLLDGLDAAHMRAGSDHRRFVVVSRELAEGGEFRDVLDAPTEEAALERVKRMREGVAEVLYASALADQLDGLWHEAARPPAEVELGIREEEERLLGEGTPSPAFDAMVPGAATERSR